MKKKQLGCSTSRCLPQAGLVVVGPAIAFVAPWACCIHNPSQAVHAFLCQVGGTQAELDWSDLCQLKFDWATCNHK